MPFPTPLHDHDDAVACPGAPADEHERTERVRFVAHDSPPNDTPATSEEDDYPQPGSRLLHFEIAEELGRGAFARVYLARQESLANRLVALKVTRVWTTEPQTLAKLRHTNVIPVYSVHEAGEFQAVCMPFLGRTTLSRVLLEMPPAPPASARALFAARPNAHDHEMSRASYADACLWLIGQLAAGLAHAHRAGVLHRDLKPGNVLLTDDGTPMLLDFNVSSSADGPAHTASSVGGTFPYMAPEHLRAFLGEAATVDARSDLFSLGVMLYQMLTLELPFPYATLPSKLETVRRQIAVQTTPPVPTNVRNPAVTPAVAAVVAKLLDRDPARRYQTADELCDDIARHLSNRPLRFAPNTSVRERTRKWRRRNPHLATALAVSAAALLLLVLPVSAAALRQTRIAARAEEVQRAEARVSADDSLATLRTAAIELGSRSDPALREHGLRAAYAELERYEVPDDPQWEQRPQFRLLDDARRAALKESFGEVLVLMTRAEADAGHHSAAALATALRWNAVAERVFPADDKPRVLARHRAELEARRDGRDPPLPRPAPTTPRDTDLLFDAYDLVSLGRYADALPLLVRFCEKHLGHVRAWYWRGVCHQVMRQPDDAATAFSVCLALVPNFAPALANRGQARLKQRRFPEAEADFTRALELRPNWTVALINRGLAREAREDFAGAEADLTAALADPAAPTQVYFLRARVRHARGDAKGNAADRIEGAARQPTDAVSWASRGVHRMDEQPKEAVADFDAALKLSPTLRDALLNKAIVLADHLKRPADAVPVLDALLDLYPDDTEARAGRGVYLARLGREAGAKRDAADVLKADPSPFRLYQAAGLYAQLAKGDPASPHRKEALTLFARALRAGFADMETMKHDTDLNPIRGDPEFARLLRAAEQLTPKP